MNKPWKKLTSVDRALRRLNPPDMECTEVLIKKTCGFEHYNTRPYHNYETWSDGYEVSIGDVKANAEDLDDAIKLLAKKLGREDRILGLI